MGSLPRTIIGIALLGLAGLAYITTLPFVGSFLAPSIAQVPFVNMVSPAIPAFAAVGLLFIFIP